MERLTLLDGERRSGRLAYSAGRNSSSLQLDTKCFSEYSMLSNTSFAGQQALLDVQLLFFSFAKLTRLEATKEPPDASDSSIPPSWDGVRPEIAHAAEQKMAPFSPPATLSSATTAQGGVYHLNV